MALNLMKMGRAELKALRWEVARKSASKHRTRRLAQIENALSEKAPDVNTTKEQSE